MVRCLQSPVAAAARTKAQITDASKSGVLGIAVHLFTRRAEPVAVRTAGRFSWRAEASRVPNAGRCTPRKAE
jgi:hypothetical protein